MNNWKKAVAFVSLIFLSILGIKPTTAAPTNQTPNPTTSPAQNCPYGGARSLYARVITKQSSSVNIRSSPNGRIIGAVPSGWAVKIGKKDPTGQWTYIDEGTFEQGRISYVNAPSLRSGWMSTQFLKQLGRFCEKPMAMLQLNPNTLLKNKTVVVQEDWMQIGDRISRTIND